MPCSRPRAASAARPSCGGRWGRRRGALGLAGEGGAIIEMAAASGLHRVPQAERDATRTCSFGTGELIREALDAGATRITLGLGGSATNDGGAGLLRALGLRLLDADGEELAPGGAALAGLACIDRSGIDPRLAGVAFDVAADVDNPLCGPRGASHVFGPQKGRARRRSRRWTQPCSAMPMSWPPNWARITAANRVSARPVGWASPRGPSSAHVSVPASNWWPSWPGWPRQWSVPTW